MVADGHNIDAEQDPDPNSHQGEKFGFASTYNISPYKNY
jgi:hypothetical protein